MEKFYSPSHKEDSRKTQTYDTQNCDGVYCVEKTGSRKETVHTRSKGTIPKLLSLFLVIVLLASVVVLTLENRNLNQRLDREISAQEEVQALLAEKERKEALSNRQVNKHMSVYSAAAKDTEEQKALSIQEIAKKGKPSVVAISTEKAVPFGFYFEAVMPVAGSGFFISDDGYIATNNHVVEGADNIRVHTDEGNLYEASIVGTDRASDLAVIKIEAEDGEAFPAITWGDSDDLEVGELAVAIGNPSGTLEGSVTAGIISALERTINIDNLELNVLQTDAAINAGNSGGALFNSFGEVIGINTAKLSGSGRTTFDGIAFAIPSNYAIRILDDLSQNGKVTSRVLLGITGRGLDADSARAYRIADRPGVLVLNVLEGSSADAAGLHSGDFIVELDGKAADSIQAINNLKKYWNIGDEINVVYFRNGERKETTMILQGEEASDITSATSEPTETEAELEHDLASEGENDFS